MPQLVVARLTQRPVLLALVLVTVVALAVAGLVALRSDEDPARTGAAPTAEPTPTPSGTSDAQGEGGEYGLRFRPTGPGTVTALSFDRPSGDTADRSVRLWTSKGELLAEATLPGREEAGWQSTPLKSPVTVKDSELYVASVSLDEGPDDSSAGTTATSAADAANVGYQSVAGAHGPSGAFPDTELGTPTVPVRPVLAGTSASPSSSASGSATPQKGAPSPTGAGAAPPGSPPRGAPTPTSAPPAGNGAFPGPGNTGVPAGVSLTDYRGPMTIRRDGTTLDAQRIEGTITIAAKNVTIKRSSVRGDVSVPESGSVTIVDSLVDGGKQRNAAIGSYNLTLRRVEVRGAAASVNCADNCDVRDSWLHAQYIQPGSDWHGDGFISNGGNNMLLRHNTLACDSEETGAGGACSAALAAYGDFGPITNMTVDNNLFVSSPAGYCLYGGYDNVKPFGSQARNVVITDNVFERGASGKCGVFGPVMNVGRSGNGNVFSGNRWDDGAPVRAG